MKVMFEAKWREQFSENGALWMHDGDPKRPHALLTSGNHSNGFFNASKVIERPRLLSEACEDLISILHDRIYCNSLPTMIVGSAMGAVTIAFEVARQLGFPNLRSTFTEPVLTASDKTMVLKRFEPSAKDKALVVEDVLTTGGTTVKTINELKSHGIFVSSFVGVLVNRSGKKTLGGRAVVGLVNKRLPIWTPDECPLCKEGSAALRPKTHWKQLVEK